MSLTNFQKVHHFNQTFGATTHQDPQKDIFKRDPKLVELRMKLIREEVEELEDAVKNHDLTETIDALSDILYVVYGAGSSFGIDLDQTFNLVHESNMSKVCQSPGEAQDTVNYYLQHANSFNIKNPTQAPVDPAYRKQGDLYIVYNQTTGKVLKSVSYKPVDFSTYLK